MNKQDLINNIKAKKSFLCVGLDPDLDKMPESLKGNLYEFNKAIIDATAQYAVAYKPNLAFYEVLGSKGVEEFEKIELQPNETILRFDNNQPCFSYKILLVLCK